MGTSFLLIPALILLLLTLSARAQSLPHLLPDKLQGLPTGLRLEHTPSPNYAEWRPADSVYAWRHDTHVTALVREPLTVVEAGSFIWFGDRWQPNMHLTPADFAEQFHCPRAALRPGRTYTLPDNTRTDRVLRAGDALWYVIATDAVGRRYKGYGLIETEAALAPRP